MFVQLKDMPIDGLVHISAIPGDYWELENGGMGLVGQRTGRRWQLGDPVRVRLNRVDLTQRQIDFELVDADAAASHGTVRAPRQGQRTQSRRHAAAPRRGQGGAKRGGRGGRG
jgi:ribonuclease R